MTSSDIKQIKQEAYKIATETIEDTMWQYANQPEKIAKLLLSFYCKGYDQAHREIHNDYLKELKEHKEKYE